MRIFISYSRQQEGWVWDRLQPCLGAGGADVLIDRERFVVGKAVVGQMDTVQDQADRPPPNPLPLRGGVNGYVLRQLLQGEATGNEWQYLCGFRRRNSQLPPQDEAVYQALRRRLLVADAGNGEWRLRVPLLQRWPRERG
jgi:hypothetical protein